MINAGTQTASAEFSDTITFSHPLFGPELGSFDTRYRGGGDTLVDLSGGVRIWGRFAVGAGVSQVSHEDEAGITGRLPRVEVIERAPIVLVDVSVFDKHPLGVFRKLSFETLGNALGIELRV